MSIPHCEHIFDTEFHSEELIFNTEFHSVISYNGEVYEGDCEITPKFEKQTLKTKNLLMNEDVTVLEIPVTRVTNTSGGTTIIIGG